MYNFLTRLAGILTFLLVLNSLIFAQSTAITGTVIDMASNEAIPGASITLKGKTTGTAADEKGKFNLKTTEKAPFTIIVSSIGYKSAERSISGSISNLVIALEAQAILGQEVVIVASRISERILESPVSIERLGAVAIRETAAPSFYDALANLKGVELSTQSFTFKSVNTRGFNSNGNIRFNQLVDGMDNQAPGLNFSVGNIVGLSDLDADHVELLPGASSALYGAGGTNGTLLLTSKSPFTYPGLSVSYKVGVNHAEDSGYDPTSWEDMAFRYAKSYNNRFAWKVNVSYTQALDWAAQNYSNFDRIARTAKSGDRTTDPQYDGINVYGDELNVKYPTLRQVAGALAAAGRIPAGAVILAPTSTVTRTGYLERDLVDYNTKSFKTSNSLHYKFTNNIEAIAQANWGSGTSVYTGTDRYSLRNFNIGQYKLELRSPDFFLRGYTTQERAGDAYNATLLGTFINEAWKPSSTWFGQYTGAFIAAKGAGANDTQAHLTARNVAEAGRPQPGSSQFEDLKKTITNINIGPAGGAKFTDKSNLYHYEGMYNFSRILNKQFEFLLGASYRVYDLNSGGTIFDDLNRDITINEYGTYGQLGKKFLNDKLKLTASGRFDKNENFEGRFTPRITGVYTIVPNNNIRLSYQTGFRNPTNQNQYIDLAVGGGTVRLIGGLPELISKYNLNTNKGFTDQSYRAFLQNPGPTTIAGLQPYTFNEKGIQPERVQAFELGYRGLLGNKLLIDTYGYYNIYNDYITAVDIYQNPTPGNPAGLANATRFNVPVNSNSEVRSYGLALGLDYIINKFNVSGNVSFNDLTDIPADYLNDFNTPKMRFNLGLSNREIIKNTGFNITYRWQDEYNWLSTFAVGNVPAFGTVDAQINLKIPAYKSTIKLGGSNILNKYYITSYGNPQIGGMYYVALIFDQFMR